MRTTLRAAITTVSASAVLGGFGLVTASASPTARQTEHFQIISTAATARRLSVIATGEFTAGGTAIGGKLTDKLVFAGGTLTIKYRSTHFTANFDRRTCLFIETQRGTYRLVDGTGKFAGISGSGRWALGLLGVFTRSKGECVHLSAPPTFQAITTAHGPISASPAA
jgi:hypothetical protein